MPYNFFSQKKAEKDIKVSLVPACPGPKHIRGRETGFTMIELMVTLALIVLLSAFAYPSIVRWGSNYRLRSAASDLLTNVHTTRMEAIKRNQNVTITYSAGGDSYTISDVNGTILNMNMPQGVDLSAVSLSANATATIFSPRGLPNNFGNIVLLNNNNNGYKLIYNITGRPRLEKSTDGGSSWVDYP
jgi:prepilin-type N-terminal cleavage/methylation domain-containing protein